MIVQYSLEHYYILPWKNIGGYAPCLQCLQACAFMDNLASLDTNLLSEKVIYSLYFVIEVGSFQFPH